MQTIKDNLATIVVGTLVIAALVTVTLVLAPWQTNADGGLQVVIHDGDGNTRSALLNEDARIIVDTSLGHNVVVIQGGAAHMEEADCPRGDCLRQGAISRPGEQLICLPHKLWVEIAQDGGGSSQMDTNAVAREKSEGADLVAR